MSQAPKNRVIAAAILVFVLCMLLPFCVLILTGQHVGMLYDDTYYGVLAPMAVRLQAAAGPKIVVVGNSGTAFGVDTAQMEDTLRADGYD